MPLLGDYPLIYGYISVHDFIKLNETLERRTVIVMVYEWMNFKYTT